MALTLRRLLSVRLVLSTAVTVAGVSGASGSTSPPAAARPADGTAIARGARTLPIAQKTGGKRSRGKKDSASKEAAGATEKPASPAPASKGAAAAAPASADGPGTDQVSKAEVAKLPASERDKQVEAVGRERWKKADPKGAPEVTPSAHFLLFGNLPKARATATLRAVEAQFGTLKTLLSRPGSPALAWDEKISVYVFRDSARFIEFVRTVDGHEVERGDRVAVNLTVPQPYIAAVDPQGGRDEPAAAKRGPRLKRDTTSASASGGRGLVGLIVESFVASAVEREGKPPRWLSLGLGEFFAARAERRGPTAARLRRDAYALFEQGWAPKVTEAMGGATKVDDIRAVGFALCEWFAAEARPSFPAFVRGMLDGQEKLDDVIRKVLGGSRDEFLTGSGEWVAANYGPDQ